jgi:hypothetical protein
LQEVGKKIYTCPHGKDSIMPTYTLDEYAALLTRTFTPRFPRDCRPRAVSDVTDKGIPVMEFLLPHPEAPQRSITLSACERRGMVESCSLWFGEAEIAGAMDPTDAMAAIEEILADRIVAIVRYKNADAYDNHRKISTAPMEWLYQMPDDEAELTAMLEKLKKPAAFFEKVSGKYIGVFEVYRWSGSEVIERT